MSERVRNLPLDAVKGIAVLLVVCGHFVPQSSPQVWREFVNFAYSFHMDVFFILSGWLYSSGWMPKQSSEVRLFLQKKLQRLMGPFVVIAALFFLIKIIAQQFFPMTTPITPETVLGLFTDPRKSFTSVLWFLEILFLNFTVFTVLSLKIPAKWLACVLLLLPCLPAVPQPALELMRCYLPSFALGTLLPPALQHRAACGRAACLGLLALMAVCFLPLGAWNHVLRGAAAVLLPLALFHLLPALGMRWFAALGLYGTSIYLFHFPCASAVKKVIDKYQMPDEFFPLAALVAITLGIVCPVLLERCVLARHARLLLWSIGEKPMDKPALLRPLAK